MAIKATENIVNTFFPFILNSVFLHRVLIQRVKLVPWDDLLYRFDLKKVLEDVDIKTI